MKEKKFSRKCPDCGIELFYTSKKHCNAAEKKNSLCRDCTNKKKSVKEEFTCFTCGKTWMDWRSQISNPEKPFCSKQCWYDSYPKSLTGQRIGKLLVLEGFRSHETTYYDCQCDCGKSTIVTHSNLLSGSTSSCGCLVVETRGNERKPLKEVVSTAVLNAYKRNARNRSYEWLLPYENFVELINGDCYYCGSGPSNPFKWKYKHEVAVFMINGIDRLDNRIGYTSENCVSCCRICNSAKGTLTIAEFKEWSIKLTAHFP